LYDKRNTYLLKSHLLSEELSEWILRDRLINKSNNQTSLISVV